jgi:2-polyprenyl-6-methoxyphenol hydroxylase-like FAD-dependent oxidoreductase
MRNDVLIIGAGPTGLVLALWLTKLGVKLRIIDKTAEAGTTSRALPSRRARSNSTANSILQIP